MKFWLNSIAVSIFFSLSLVGAECSSTEKEILPKFFKARSTVNSNPLLLKISQAKTQGPESCSFSVNEVGWKQISYVFSQKAPLKVVVLSSTPGSFFWKAGHTFFIKTLVLEKRQGSKELYRFEMTDPKTQSHYDFELKLPSLTTKLRIK